MPDLGISVLFKGKNMIRLLGGLWVALRISLISVVISIPLGILLRTRRLRRKRPMVLHWRRCGRAGGRRIKEKNKWELVHIETDTGK